MPMTTPLKSKLLSDNQRLQACLSSDSAHVAPGAAGLHVHLIQLSLMIIDRLPIAKGEFSAKQYGATTAAAVLSYKKKRKIINQSYQTKEDSIVGKMTIASMDKDIAQLEDAPLNGPAPVSKVCDCKLIGLPVRIPAIRPISKIVCERIASEARDQPRIA